MEKSHISKIKVYYPEVDSLGVVYHSNYLEYADRARCDWLEAMGFPISEVESTFGVLFAVKDLNISYLQPAKFGQEIFIISNIIELRKASVVYRQYICKDMNAKEKLCSVDVVVVCVDKSLKPKAFPKPVYHKFEGVCCDGKS